MPADTQAILAQIDAVIAECKPFFDVDNEPEFSPQYALSLQKLKTRLASTIHRLAPATSIYKSELKDALLKPGHSKDHISNLYLSVFALYAAVHTLRDEYNAGFLRTVEELVHADVFSNMLEMALHLLERNYKDAAAVIAGSVLEQHLRSLSTKTGIPVRGRDGRYRKAESLNTDLCSNGAYRMEDQKSVTAWLALRNNAAHGNYGQYDKTQVRLFIENVLNFMARNPA
jgi:hypothetical protein